MEWLCSRLNVDRDVAAAVVRLLVIGKAPDQTATATREARRRIQVHVIQKYTTEPLCSAVNLGSAYLESGYHHHQQSMPP